MALHLKTKWRKRGPKTIEDRATVVASNIWRIAQETCRHMEIEGYKLGSDAQVAGVMTELMSFLVQIADRIVYGQLSEDDRSRFVHALGKNLARITSNNLAEFVGPGKHIHAFIDTLNARSLDYAEFEFNDMQPSYTFVRYLGEKVSQAMQATDSKWVLEQVVDVEAPVAIAAVKKMVGAALGVKVS